MSILNPILVVAGMLAGFSVTAHADTPASGAGTITRGQSVVYYGDLNIDDERDARVLLRRIERGAKKACGGHPTFSSYTHFPDHTFEECREKAIQRAVKFLAAPRVTRLYFEGRP